MSFLPISLGGLFEPEELIQQAAFTHSLDAVNKDKSVLPHFKLNGQTKVVASKDSFAVSQESESLCPTQNTIGFRQSFLE